MGELQTILKRERDAIDTNKMIGWKEFENMMRIRYEYEELYVPARRKLPSLADIIKEPARPSRADIIKEPVRPSRADSKKLVRPSLAAFKKPRRVRRRPAPTRIHDPKPPTMPQQTVPQSSSYRYCTTSESTSESGSTTSNGRSREPSAGAHQCHNVD